MLEIDHNLFHWSEGVTINEGSVFGRGGGTGGAGGAIAPPTFGILLSMHDLAPPTFWADPYKTAPPIFHTFRRLCTIWVE